MRASQTLDARDRSALAEAAPRPSPGLSAEEARLLRLTLAAREAEIAALQERTAEAERSILMARDRVRALEMDLAERFRELAALARLHLGDKDRKGRAPSGRSGPPPRLGPPPLSAFLGPDELRAALAARDARLEAMLGSTSWRLTAPLRRAGAWRASTPASRVEPSAAAAHGSWTPAELCAAIAARDAQIADLEGSTSWRLTRGLRAAVDRLRRR